MFNKKRKQARVIQVQDKLISGDVTDEFFACDVSKCKGACCVEGDLGAPLNKAEVQILDKIYDKVKPYLRKEGIDSIEKQGTSIIDFTNNPSTPLVNGKECAYVTFSDTGIALCGIEQAYEAGEIPFKKPISCHLYPIRVQKYKDFEALNYDRWEICSDACNRGDKEKIRVYEFTKDALIRAYGEEFYEELDQVVKAYESDGTAK